MKIQILAIGKMKRGPESELLARYQDRAIKSGKSLGLRGVNILQFSEGRQEDKASRIKAEAAELLTASTGSRRIALDETGKAWSTRDLANYLQQGLHDATDVSFLIGGADGLDDRVRSQADVVIALGRMTWPHQIARLLLCEQIYRVMTMLSGHPYHRE
jgi:23S rRNA (pseudouridine1915-N3)-methyltransferase